MPKVNDLGYGPSTPDKIKAFRSILQMHMAITRAVWYKHRDKNPLPYLYLDLTAGPGYAHPEEPEKYPGSPLIFLDLATRPLPKGRSKEKFLPPVPFESHFFEKDPLFADELRRRIRPFRKHPCALSLQVHNADYTDPNRGALALVTPWGDQTFRFGLVYVDPSGNLPEFDVLSHLAQRFPRMEFLLHIPATVVKRRAKAHGIQERLMDLIQRIPKARWLIRDTRPRDKFQWTFLLGTNARTQKGAPLFQGLKRERFYRLDTKEGQKVLERLTYTQQEIQARRQPPLPFLSD